MEIKTQKRNKAKIHIQISHWTINCVTYNSLDLIKFAQIKK